MSYLNQQSASASHLHHLERQQHNNSPFKATPTVYSNTPGGAGVRSGSNNSNIGNVSNASFGSNHSKATTSGLTTNTTTMATTDANTVPLSGKALEHWLSLQKRATHHTPKSGSKHNSRTNSPSPSPRNPLVVQQQKHQDVTMINSNNTKNHLNTSSNFDTNSTTNQTTTTTTTNDEFMILDDANLPPHLSPQAHGQAVLLSEGRKRNLERMRREWLARKQQMESEEEDNRRDIMRDAFSANFVDLLFALSSFQKIESVLCKAKLSKTDRERLKKSRNEEEHDLIFAEILRHFRSDSYNSSVSNYHQQLSVPWILRRIMMITNEIEEDLIQNKINGKNPEDEQSIAIQVDTLTANHQSSDLQLVEENVRLRGQLDFVMNHKLDLAVNFFRGLLQHYHEELEESSDLLEQTMQELEQESKRRMDLEMEQLALAKKCSNAEKLLDDVRKQLAQEKKSADLARKERDEMAKQLEDAFDEVDAQTMSKAQLATQAARDRLKSSSTKFVSSEKSTQTQIGNIVVSSTGVMSEKTRKTIKNRSKSIVSSSSSSSLVSGPRNPRDCGEVFLNTQTVPGANEISLFAASAECFMRGGYHYRQGVVEINLAKGVVQHFSDYEAVLDYRNSNEMMARSTMLMMSPTASTASPMKNNNTTEPHPNVSVKISTIAAVDRLPFIHCSSNKNNNSTSNEPKKSRNALRLLLTQDHSHIDLVLNSRRDLECVFEALSLARSTFVSRCFVQKPWGDSAPSGMNVMPSATMTAEQSAKVDQSTGADGVVVVLNNPSSTSEQNNQNNSDQQQKQQNVTIKRIHTRTNAMEYDYRVRLISTKSIPNSLLLSGGGDLGSQSPTIPGGSPLLAASGNLNNNNNNLRKLDSMAFFGGSTTFSPEMNSQTSIAQGSGSLYLTLQRMHQCRIAWVAADDILSGVVSQRELAEISRTSNILVMWRQVHHRNNETNKPPLLTSFINFGGSTSGDAKNKTGSHFAKWSVVVSASSSSVIQNVFCSTTQLLIAATRESLPWIGAYRSARQKFCSQLSLSLYVLGSKLTFVSCDFKEYQRQQQHYQHYQQGVSSNNKPSTGVEQSCPRLELLQNEVFCSGSECVFFLCPREGGDVEYLQENAEDVLLGRNGNGESSSSATQTPLSFALVPNDDYDDDDDDDDDENENGNKMNSLEHHQQDHQTPTTKSNNNRPVLQLNSFLENDSFSSSYRPTTKISKRQPTLAVLMCSHSFLPNYTGSTIWRPNSVRDPTATELADGMIQRAAHSTLIPIRRVPCTILGQYQNQLLLNSGSGGSSLRIKSLQMELFSTVENIATLTCALTSSCFEDCWFGLDQVKSMNSNSKYQLSSSSVQSIEFITDDRTRVASEVITFKARYSTSTSSSDSKKQQGKQLQHSATSEIIKTDINSSKIIFGYFSLLSAKGWIPGSGETIRCSFRLFKFPKQKEEEEDDDETGEGNGKEKEGTTTSNVRDPSDDSSDDDEGKNDEEDDFNVFAEFVGECTVDLCL